MEAVFECVHVSECSVSSGTVCQGGMVAGILKQIAKRIPVCLPCRIFATAAPLQFIAPSDTTTVTSSLSPSTRSLDETKRNPEFDVLTPWIAFSYASFNRHSRSELKRWREKHDVFNPESDRCAHCLSLKHSIFPTS